MERFFIRTVRFEKNHVSLQKFFRIHEFYRT